jgi:predicted Zn-dependent protease
MDLQKMIAELEAERNRLDEAIEALERLNSKTPSRRSAPQMESIRDVDSERRAPTTRDH